MRQMADGSGNVIVFLIVKHHGDCPQGADKLLKFGHRLRTDFCRGRKDIIGVFKKIRAGMFIPAFFRTCHRMSANEIRRNPGVGNLLVDRRFDASNICDDAALPSKF